MSHERRLELLQACDAKLRAEMLEAKVAPLRLAKQQSEKDSEEKKKAQESAYRCKGHWTCSYARANKIVLFCHVVVHATAANQHRPCTCRHSEGALEQ